MRISKKYTRYLMAGWLMLMGSSLLAQYLPTHIPTTTFESNRYNLGHFLEDNAKQFYMGVEYHPIRALNIRAYYSHAEKDLIIPNWVLCPEKKSLPLIPSFGNPPVPDSWLHIK
jgi:hypothetical protein